MAGKPGLLIGARGHYLAASTMASACWSVAGCGIDLSSSPYWQIQAIRY